MRTTPGRGAGSGAPVLVLVTGASRSGTSTAAGALHHLGLHVPGPLKEPDEANPRGYFETVWVNDFHKSVLNPIPVRTGDSRPAAAQEAAEAASEPEVIDRLRDWLAAQVRDADGARQLMVKDPRAIWLPELWRSVTADLGIDLRYVVMLRHPVEVARSRDSAFLQEREDAFRRRRETSNVAAWCNLMATAERATRGTQRCFLRYTDLVTDWRGAMERVADQLDVDLGDLARDVPSLEGFVDPALYRSAPHWEDVDVPPGLPDLAERVWAVMQGLVAAPYDDALLADLEGLAGDYARMHDYATAMALDAITAQDVQTRARVRRRLQTRHRTELHELRQELSQARGRDAPGADGDVSGGASGGGLVRRALRRVGQRID